MSETLTGLSFDHPSQFLPLLRQIRYELQKQTFRAEAGLDNQNKRKTQKTKKKSIMNCCIPRSAKQKEQAEKEKANKLKADKGKDDNDKADMKRRDKNEKDSNIIIYFIEPEKKDNVSEDNAQAKPKKLKNSEENSEHLNALMHRVRCCHTEDVPKKLWRERPKSEKRKHKTKKKHHGKSKQMYISNPENEKRSPPDTEDDETSTSSGKPKSIFSRCKPRSESKEKAKAKQKEKEREKQKAIQKEEEEEKRKQKEKEKRKARQGDKENSEKKSCMSILWKRKKKKDAEENEDDEKEDKKKKDKEMEDKEKEENNLNISENEIMKYYVDYRKNATVVCGKYPVCVQVPNNTLLPKKENRPKPKERDDYSLAVKSWISKTEDVPKVLFKYRKKPQIVEKKPKTFTERIQEKYKNALALNKNEKVSKSNLKKIKSNKRQFKKEPTQKDNKKKLDKKKYSNASINKIKNILSKFRLLACLKANKDDKKEEDISKNDNNSENKLKNCNSKSKSVNDSIYRVCKLPKKPMITSKTILSDIRRNQPLISNKECKITFDSPDTDKYGLSDEIYWRRKIPKDYTMSDTDLAILNQLKKSNSCLSQHSLLDDKCRISDERKIPNNSVICNTQSICNISNKPKSSSNCLPSDSLSNKNMTASKISSNQ